MLRPSVMIVLFSVFWAAVGTSIFYRGRGIQVTSVFGRPANIVTELLVYGLTAAFWVMVVNVAILMVVFLAGKQVRTRTIITVTTFLGTPLLVLAGNLIAYRMMNRSGVPWEGVLPAPIAMAGSWLVALLLDRLAVNHGVRARISYLLTLLSWSVLSVSVLLIALSYQGVGCWHYSHPRYTALWVARGSLYLASIEQQGKLAVPHIGWSPGGSFGSPARPWSWLPLCCVDRGFGAARVQVDFPLYLGIVLGAIGITWTLLPFSRHRQRLRLGLCVKCGYDLQALTEPRCPECGTEIQA